LYQLRFGRMQICFTYRLTISQPDRVIATIHAFFNLVTRAREGTTHRTFISYASCRRSVWRRTDRIRRHHTRGGLRKRERKRASPSRWRASDRVGSAAPPRRDRHPLERERKVEPKVTAEGRDNFKSARESVVGKRRMKECQNHTNLRIQLSAISSVRWRSQWLNLCQISLIRSLALLRANAQTIIHYLIIRIIYSLIIKIYNGNIDRMPTVNIIIFKEYFIEYFTTYQSANVFWAFNNYKKIQKTILF